MAKELPNLRSKIFKWTSLIAQSSFMQILVQGFGFLSGILIIRFLSIEEYAYYTIANALLGTMILLGDGGIGAGVMAEGGKYWENRNKLGVVLKTGLDLRNKFTTTSLIISIPILFYLLMSQGASLVQAGIICASLIPTFLASVSDMLLEIPLRLHQDIKKLQNNQLQVSLGRAFLTIPLILLFPFAFIGIIANGIARIYGNIRLRKLADNIIGVNFQADKEVRMRILRVVKRVLPGAIYYCLSGHLTIFIMSLFGDTKSLAQIGALERFIMTLTIIHTVANILIVPRFARLFLDKNLLFRRYIQILILSLVMLFSITILFYLFSDLLLLLLGDGYQNLKLELVLCIFGGSIDMIAGIMNSLSNSKGWILRPSVSILISCLSIGLGIFLFDVTALLGVLYYFIFLATVQFAISNTHLIYRIERL